MTKWTTPIVLAFLVISHAGAQTDEEEPDAKELDANRCSYMLVDKSMRVPVTVLGMQVWCSDVKPVTGMLESLKHVPDGSWLWIGGYGAEKSQRLDDLGSVNLAPLARFNDGDIYSLSVGPTYRVYIRDADLKALSRFRSIRGLTIAVDEGFTDARLLTQFRELEYLSVYDAQQQFFNANEAMETLRSMKHLRLLHLIDAPCNDTTIEAICGLSLLESLVLSTASISDKGLKQIAKLSKLEELILRNPRDQNFRITEDGIAALSQLNKLQSVQIDAINVSANGAAVTALKNQLRAERFEVGIK